MYIDLNRGYLNFCGHDVRSGLPNIFNGHDRCCIFTNSTSILDRRSERSMGEGEIAFPIYFPRKKCFEIGNSMGCFSPSLSFFLSFLVT